MNNIDGAEEQFVGKPFPNEGDEVPQEHKIYRG